MMPSWHGRTFRFADTLWGESTGHCHVVPFIKAIVQSSDVFSVVSLSLNKLLNKQSNYQCCGTPWFLNDLQFFASQIAKFMGPTWVLSAPDGPHVGPMNLAIRVTNYHLDLRRRPGDSLQPMSRGILQELWGPLANRDVIVGRRSWDVVAIVGGFHGNTHDASEQRSHIDLRHPAHYWPTGPWEMRL